MVIINIVDNRGFINDQARLTRSGKLAARCPLEPIWYHAIEVGASLGCSMNMVDITVLCNSPKPILSHMPRYEQVADRSRGAIATFPSDHLTLVNAFDSYMRMRELYKDDEGSKLRNWCVLAHLDYAALEEVRRSRESLGPFLKKTAKLAPTRVSTEDTSTVLKALAIALCTRTAIYHGGYADEYRTVHENISTRVGSKSSVLPGDYEWVVFNDLIKTGATVHMETVTPIDAEWLVVSVHIKRVPSHIAGWLTGAQDLPYFQDLPLKGSGLLRQDFVKKSLDTAKARIGASKVN